LPDLFKESAMMSIFSRIALVSSVVIVSACAEDLTAVNATWATAEEGFKKAVTEATAAGTDLGEKAKALALKEGDTAGTELKAAFDKAIGEHTAAIAGMTKAAGDAAAAVASAQEQKKILPVQEAITSGSAAFTAAQGKATEAAKAAIAALDALKAHVDAEAAKANTAVDPAAKDAEAVKAAGGEATGFTFVYTDKNAIDEAQSAASIERLTKLLASCDGLKVDLVATGAVDAATARAESLKKFMDGKGGKGKIGKASGAEGDGSTKVVVTAPCK
jgi:hypothetical protein